MFNSEELKRLNESINDSLQESYKIAAAIGQDAMTLEKRLHDFGLHFFRYRIPSLSDNKIQKCLLWAKDQHKNQRILYSLSKDNQCVFLKRLSECSLQVRLEIGPHLPDFYKSLINSLNTIKLNIQEKEEHPVSFDDAMELSSFDEKILKGK